MATSTKGYASYVDLYGPSGGKIATANLSLTITTGAVVIVESQGFASIVKSGTGTYTLTLLRKPKNVNVTLGVGGTPVAGVQQDVRVLSKNVTTGVIVIQVSTAATGVAAEPTSTILLDVQAVLRTAN